MSKMADVKYIIVKEGGCSRLEFAIVFSAILNHSKVASAFGKEKVVAAGKCYRNDAGTWVAYGDSPSLGGLKSRNEVDSKVIAESIEPQDY